MVCPHFVLERHLWAHHNPHTVSDIRESIGICWYLKTVSPELITVQPPVAVSPYQAEGCWAATCLSPHSLGFAADFSVPVYAGYLVLGLAENR